MRRRRTLRRILEAVAVAVVVTALWAVLMSVDAFAGFQRRAADAFFPSARRDPETVVIGLDNKSIRAIGPIPWRRSVHAQLARRLARAGVKSAAWDVVFGGQGLDPADNADFAAALRELPGAVLAEQISTRPSRIDPTLLDTKVEAAPIGVLVDGTGVAVAHAEVTPDPSDGVVRTIPAVVSQGGALVPGLAVAALRSAHGETGPVVIQPDGLQAGRRFVPTEGRHALRLNWAEGLDHIGRPAVVSAVDVLEGRVDPSKLRGKVAFIGAVEPTLGDNQLVPVDKSGGLPGVMIHANALNTMLTASYLEPVTNTETTLWVAVLTLIMALAVLFLPGWFVLIAVALVPVLSGVYVLGVSARFDAGHIPTNFWYPIVALPVSFVAALIVRYVTETRQRRRVSSLFAQYVPETVARELEESGRLEAHIEGERLDTSLFFCDLRGFTSMSATLEPSEVRAMLNQFYEMVTDAILSHRGTVLKFVGDEVFAVFGAPLPVEDHPQVALESAMEIQRRAPELDEELAHLGIPPMMFGIGMNSGPVVAAHIGGGKRRQYDIVGDTVNLASRLCGQAGKGEIVITDGMRERLSNPPDMSSMGRVALKGLDEPVPLFKIVVDPSRAEAR
ncbi:MAG TPA: adenylate/guanylate cyclase domain-containing protein [Acidimicrobiia bacterium]